MTEVLIGKVRTIRINKKIIKGFNSVSFFINPLSFFKIRNVRQPAAISQNLVGIKKYAALWFTLLIIMYAIRDIKVKNNMVIKVKNEYWLCQFRTGL